MIQDRTMRNVEVALLVLFEGSSVVAEELEGHPVDDDEKHRKHDHPSQQGRVIQILQFPHQTHKVKVSLLSTFSASQTKI